LKTKKFGLKLTNSEGNEVLWLGDFALVVQKSGGSELFGLVPEVGVHVDGVQQRDDLRVFRDLVAVESHVPVNKNNNLLTKGKKIVLSCYFDIVGVKLT
jgi:hypothetical protein